MKKIEAIIRKTKFEDVKEALLAADIEWFSYYDVRGEGKMRQARIYRGVMYDTSCIERILINVVVRDKNMEKTVSAIQKAAYTGEIGDGRIFVIPIEDAIRIRTAERGDIALYNAEQEKLRFIRITKHRDTQTQIIETQTFQYYEHIIINYRQNRRCGGIIRHRMDVACGHACIFHATRFCTLRGWFYTQQEYRQHIIQELC